MIAASFTVKLTLQGPILTQSTTQGRYGIDAVMAVSGDRYYLPGTLVKGLIGEAWRELASIEPGFHERLKRWIGAGSSNQNLPDRGRLFFEDLRDPTTPTNGTRTQTRIEIDDVRGSVKHGHLRMSEAPYPPGKSAEFTGKLQAIGETPNELEDARKAVRTALRWIASAGSDRTIGFGRILAAECGPLEAVQWNERPTPSTDTTFHLKLTFDRPVCFAQRRLAGNLFESEDWISGAALKGSLAFLLDCNIRQWPNLREHLHAVRFTHAFPAEAGATNPEPVRPYSLAKVPHGDGKATLDLIRVLNPRLIDDKVPEFQPDWKPDGEPWPKTELRVRTAIDGEAKRAATSELFAYQMIVPEGVVWHAEVAVEGVEESARAAVAGELREALRNGLFALGKTKAHAKIIIAPLTRQPAIIQDEQTAITLKSAALLCDPGRLTPDGGNGTTDRDAMWAEYARAWHELSGGTLELTNYFHRQTLAGSGYIRHRFQSGKLYKPYLLTDRGSVFLFKTKAGAQARLDRWLTSGIELSPSVKRFYELENTPPGLLWQSCPFLPENGFGEIALDVKVPDVEVLDA